MILIIDLDKLFLFFMSFYALYQLVFEIHYLVTYELVDYMATWHLEHVTTAWRLDFKS